MKIKLVMYSILISIIPLSLLSLPKLPQGNRIKSERIKRTEGIHWHSFQEAIQLNSKEPKKIYIDVFTNWCGWCKKMDQTSFEDPKIIQEMNSDYYAVKLNAETRDSILFRDHSFKYMPQYKSNELAMALLNGQMAFPTTVILDQDEKILSRIPGYLDSNSLIDILGYFGKNNHLKFTWNQYQKSLGHDTLGKK